MKVPLAIVLCEDQLRFIFFPFEYCGIPCIDAIVTHSIDLFTEHYMIDERWFSFICYYLTNNFSCLTATTDLLGFAPHQIKNYVKVMVKEPTTDELKVRKGTAICTGRDCCVCEGHML